MKQKDFLEGTGQSRRGWLRAATLLGTAAAAPRLAAASGRSRKRAATVRRYRTLGRTGLKVSDISFGSSVVSDPDLVRYAFDRGVNYFDSAESYRGGRAEQAIGKALGGVRDQVYITSKTKAGADDSRQDMMAALEGSLKRLGTDYIDVYFMHAVNDVARMKNPEWPEFISRAKAQGKIRFSGMSGHGSRLVPSLEYAVDNDLVDVVLCAFNFGQDPSFYEKVIRQFHFIALQPELPRVLEKARAKNIGIVAMKVLMGARLNDLKGYEKAGATFSQAAFSWVLDYAHVDAAVISMTTHQEIDEYLRASGQRFSAHLHLPILEQYAERHGANYCQHGCNVCESSCPVGMPIAEVLRTRMYAVDYGRLDQAREDYATLSRPAEVCLGCTAQACQSACPNGIPIATRTRATAALLA